MSQSLYSAISGIKAAQTNVDVIANNIANMSTTAFKSSSVNFQNIFSKTMSEGSAASGDLGGTNPMQVGLGTSVAGITKDFTSGSVVSTGVSTNLFINGSGYFTLSNPNGGMYLSRAGDFTLDASGYLVNSSGLKVLGTSSTDGSTASTSPIQIPVSIDAKRNAASATTTVANTLNSSGTAVSEGTFTLTMNGTTETINTTGKSMDDIITSINGLNFGGDTVTASLDSTGKLQLTNNSATNSLTLADGTGTLLNTSGLAANSGGTIAAGASASSNALSDDASVTIGTATNSSDTVSLKSISIGSSGSITATYSNGDQLTVSGEPTRSLEYITSTGRTVSGTDLTVNGSTIIPQNFQIQMSNVVNENGLVSAGGNLFTVGANAGKQTFGTGSSNGMGSLVSGELEGSNVDLSTQFSNLVVAQRSIDANSKTFTAENQILQTVVNLIR